MTYPWCKELVFCTMAGFKKAVEVRGPFDYIKIVGKHGWVHGCGESLCFDPAKWLTVNWRDGNGAWHVDGHYPSAAMD